MRKFKWYEKVVIWFYNRFKVFVCMSLILFVANSSLLLYTTRQGISFVCNVLDVSIIYTNCISGENDADKIKEELFSITENGGLDEDTKNIIKWTVNGDEDKIENYTNSLNTKLNILLVTSVVLASLDLFIFCIFSDMCRRKIDDIIKRRRVSNECMERDEHN